jgi:hypothetical protein
MREVGGEDGKCQFNHLRSCSCLQVYQRDVRGEGIYFGLTL